MTKRICERRVSQNSTCPAAAVLGSQSAFAPSHCQMHTHVLGSAEGDACDALNVLQTKLGDGLASLLLVAGVDSDGGALGDDSLALALGLVAGLILLDLDVLLLGLVGELFNAGVGHDVGCGEIVLVVLHSSSAVWVGASKVGF
jgi:hypothetical protein